MMHLMCSFVPNTVFHAGQIIFSCSFTRLHCYISMYKSCTCKNRPPPSLPTGAVATRDDPAGKSHSSDSA